MGERPWIEHDGMGCPVARGTLVDIRRRSGAEQTVVALSTLGFGDSDAEPYVGPVDGSHPNSWVWGDGAPSCVEIIAYRLASDPDAEAKRQRYTAIFDDMIKTAPLDIPARESVEALGRQV